MANPTKRTQAAVDRVLEAVSEGITLTAVCRELGMSTRLWSRWTQDDPELATAFLWARNVGADALADMALKIAMTPEVGVVKKFTEKGVEETHEDMLGHRRLQVDTILKLLAKWYPARYGDRLTHDLGEDTLAALLSEGSKKDDK